MLNFIKSLGLKRYVASALTSVGGIISAIPGLEAYAIGVQTAAASLGAVGVVHASVAQTVTAGKLSTLTSILSVLVVAADSFSFLAPYKALITSIATLFGVATVSRGIASTQKVIAEK